MSRLIGWCWVRRAVHRRVRHGLTCVSDSCRVSTTASTLGLAADSRVSSRLTGRLSIGIVCRMRLCGPARIGSLVLTRLKVSRRNRHHRRTRRNGWRPIVSVPRIRRSTYRALRRDWPISDQQRRPSTRPTAKFADKSVLVGIIFPYDNRWGVIQFSPILACHCGRRETGTTGLSLVHPTPNVTRR